MSIFIDTGIWIGYFNASDEKADRSVEIIEEIQKGKFGVAWTSLFVVNELFTFLERRTRNIQLAIDAATIVLGKREEFKPFAKIHPVSYENCLKALELATKYADRMISFTDLISLVICMDLNIESIATYDRHFQGLIHTIN